MGNGAQLALTLSFWIGPWLDEKLGPLDYVETEFILETQAPIHLEFDIVFP